MNPDHFSQFPPAVRSGGSSYGSSKVGIPLATHPAPFEENPSIDTVRSLMISPVCASFSIVPVWYRYLISAPSDPLFLLPFPGSPFPARLGPLHFSGGKCLEIVSDNEKYISPPAAVSAVRSPFGNILLSPKGDPPAPPLPEETSI